MQNLSNRIAGQANTASKAPGRYPENYPKEIIKGKGAYVYGEDGKRYLDFCCSLGPVILGHSYPQVDEAVIKAIREGSIFSLPHPRERRLAELLHELIPTAEMSRFMHNGKDATEAAVRLARHITGREMVLSFSYHGASDVFMASTKADKGVPKCLKETIKEFDYNDFDTVKKLFVEYDVAAVILEPHTIRAPENGFLEFLREITLLNGSLLIFDEVVSFPRYPKYSAQSYFEVYPDLTCISKGMANGYPISALVGKERFMKELKDGGVFVSTTFGGCNLGVSAALATLKIIVDHDVPNHLRSVGKLFRDSIVKNDRVKTTGCHWRQFLDCSDEDRQKIWQEMIKQGVFFSVPIFFNYSMTEGDILSTTAKLNEIIGKLDKIKLEGRQTSEVFKKR